MACRKRGRLGLDPINDNLKNVAVECEIEGAFAHEVGHQCAWVVDWSIEEYCLLFRRIGQKCWHFSWWTLSWCLLYASVQNGALKTCTLFMHWRFVPGLALRTNFKQNRHKAASTVLVLGSRSITSSSYCMSWSRWKGVFKPFGISVEVTNERSALCDTKKWVERIKVRGANSGIKRTFNSGNGW